MIAVSLPAPLGPCSGHGDPRSHAIGTAVGRKKKPPTPAANTHWCRRDA